MEPLNELCEGKATHELGKPATEKQTLFATKTYDANKTWRLSSGLHSNNSQFTSTFDEKKKAHSLSTQFNLANGREG